MIGIVMPLSKSKTANIKSKVSNSEHQIQGIILYTDICGNMTMLSAPASTDLAGPAIPADKLPNKRHNKMTLDSGPC